MKVGMCLYFLCCLPKTTKSAQLLNKYLLNESSDKQDSQIKTQVEIKKQCLRDYYLL